jgi:endonuclease/exonuclease/phosphatase family metal-dependent hydrolase
MPEGKKQISILTIIILIFGLLILAGFGYKYLSGWGSAGEGAGKSDVIVMDGSFEEWEYRSPIYTDPEGDHPGETIDFTTLYVDNDQDYLYLNIALNSETNLQNGSGLELYIDTDNDPSTGEAYNGIGADLVYDLGRRNGRYYQGGMRKPLSHDLIGLLTMPTVTSETFEIGIARTTLPGDVPIFPSDEIKISIAHNVEGGDILPDTGETIAYTFSEEIVAPPESIALEKDDPNHLRIVSWNALQDGLLKEGRSEHFYSVLKALDPDIINLQEMYVTQGPEVQEQMQAWFPETEWHVHKMGDLITISRYPIVRPDEGRLPIISGASPVLIEISEDQQLMIVNTHFRCCDQDELRQREIDELMGFLLDATSPGERVDLRPETPFLILGDMNLVGYAQQVDSLLTGDIVNEERYGPDFDPDWDGTPLTDVLLRHTETRHTYTWRDAETSFSPGRLDYIIYSDSMITVVKHFILDTGELSAEKLAEYGLAADDSILATDHLTLVVDIVVK